MIGDVMDVMENLEILWELNTPFVSFRKTKSPAPLRRLWSHLARTDTHDHTNPAVGPAPRELALLYPAKSKRILLFYNIK